MEKTIYKVPVVWQMMGYLSITASNQKEAIDLAEKEGRICPLPANGEYLEDSFQIDDDILSYIDDEDSDTILDGMPIPFDSGGDFWNYLKATFGYEVALKKTKFYLDLPLEQDRPDYAAEQQFRKELYDAMQNRKTAPGAKECQELYQTVSDFLDSLPPEGKRLPMENEIAGQLESIRESLRPYSVIWMTDREDNSMYKNGHDFFDDLVKTYGKEEGMNKAKRYLEIPLSHLKEADRVSEIAFRDELRKSMSALQ